MVFLIVSMAVVGLTGASAVLGPRIPPFLTQESIQGPNGTSDYNSTTGLNLTLSLSGRILDVGDYLTINATVFNTRYSQANLPGSEQSRSFVFGPAPCSQLPLGVGIARGNWSASEISGTSPLQLYYPGIYNCPPMSFIDYFTIPPRSDLVTPYSSQASGEVSLGAENGVLTLEAWGYWTEPRQANGTLTSYPGQFSSFEPGVYTAIADDPWGQVALLSFVVQDASSLHSCTSMGSNPSFASHPIQPVQGSPLALSAYYTSLHDNDSVFLALDNVDDSSVTIVNLGGAGGEYFQFQGNMAPGETTIGSWYGIVSGAVSFPAVIPAHGCFLLHLEPPGPAISYLGVTMQFSSGGNETILKGGLPLQG